jgi:aspartyl-tRNA(Asn)/glutamyl-tRNA(Gln) amidotransferase subunit A
MCRATRSWRTPGAFNAYGIPAISVPCGFTSKGLPVGLMIVGPRFAEGKVLALAHAFEQATDFHTKKPPIRPETPVPPLAPTEEERERLKDERPK